MCVSSGGGREEHDGFLGRRIERAEGLVQDGLERRITPEGELGALLEVINKSLKTRN